MLHYMDVEIYMMVCRTSSLLKWMKSFSFFSFLLDTVLLLLWNSPHAQVFSFFMYFGLSSKSSFGKLPPGWRYSETLFAVLTCRQGEQKFLWWVCTIIFYIRRFHEMTDRTEIALMLNLLTGLFICWQIKVDWLFHFYWGIVAAEWPTEVTAT